MIPIIHLFLKFLIYLLLSFSPLIGFFRPSYTIVNCLLFIFSKHALCCVREEQLVSSLGSCSRGRKFKSYL